MSGSSEPSSSERAPLLRHVVLVGMMGSGKTSVGRLLASRLAVAFFDSDAEVEASAGMSITEIFERCGEAAFRARERRAVLGLLDGAPGVLAAGGGAFVDPEIRDGIQARGISIWLHADAGTLWRRTGDDPHRPLLRTADPRAALERLLAQRAPAYGRADVIIDTTALDQGEVVGAIARRLDAGHGGRRPGETPGGGA